MSKLSAQPVPSLGASYLPPVPKPLREKVDRALLEPPDGKPNIAEIYRRFHLHTSTRRLEQDRCGRFTGVPRAQVSFYGIERAAESFEVGVSFGLLFLRRCVVAKA